LSQLLDAHTTTQKKSRNIKSLENLKNFKFLFWLVVFYSQSFVFEPKSVN